MIYLYRTYSSVLRVWSLLFDKQAKREREDKSMNRIKELLKDKKVVAGVVAAVVVLFAVGGTTVYLANSKDGDKTTAAETQNMQTEAKKTEKTTAAMEIAQAHDTTGAGETIATETAVEVENEAGVSEETEAEQKPETVESAQPEETPHREEAVSENTGNDAEEEKEPEVVEDTASEPEEAPASEPTPEPAPAPEPETEAAPTLTDEERLVATGKWVFDSAWDTPRGHVNCYYYTDAITGYKIDVSFGDGKYSSCSTSGSEDLRAIFDAHGISLDGKKVNIDLMLML